METVSLKEHFSEILKEKDRTLAVTVAAAKEAVDVAEANAQNWRNNANEWRAAMNDREAKFVTVDTFVPFKEQVVAWLAEHKGRKQGLGEGWGYLVGAIGLIVTIWNIVDRLVQ